MACYRCGTPRFGESGVLGQGGSCGIGGKGGGLVGGGSGKAAGFNGQGTVASAMGGMRIVGPTGRDQAHVPRGEPTFRKGNGAKGNGKAGRDSGAGVGGRFLAAVVVRLLVGVEGLGRFLLVPSLLKGIRRFLLRGRWLSFWNRR